MYAWVCPKCGAYLDPGEKCDCQGKRVYQNTATFLEEASGQLRFSFAGDKVIHREEAK